MRICRTVEDMRAAMRDLRAGGKHVALVPTMGALHAGHMTLVARAGEVADHVTASIFVNPAQFENPDDLAAYPRTVKDDLARFEAAGVAAVFLPDPGEIYPEGAETIVKTTRLASMLHGRVRPGHFRGVTTVVAKLFNIVGPDFAVFGEKDYQQLVIIRRMVRDLFFPVEIIGVPTVREADGLAMSSRNQRLSAADRAAAVVLNQALDAAERLVAAGTTVDALRDAVTAIISAEPRATVGAVDLCRADDLADMTGPVTTPAALMISAQFGDILLIDQRVIYP